VDRPHHRRTGLEDARGVAAKPRQINLRFKGRRIQATAGIHIGKRGFEMQALHLGPRAVREARLHLQRGLGLERDRLRPGLHRQTGRHRICLHLQRRVAALDRHIGAQFAAAHREGLGQTERRPEITRQRRELHGGLATHRTRHPAFFLSRLQRAFRLGAHPWRGQVELGDCKRPAVNSDVHHQRHVTGRRRLFALRADREPADSQAARDRSLRLTADRGGQRAFRRAAADPRVAGRVLDKRCERREIHADGFQRHALRLFQINALAEVADALNAPLQRQQAAAHLHARLHQDRLAVRGQRHAPFHLLRHAATRTAVVDRRPSARHIQIDRDIDDRQEKETLFFLYRFCTRLRLLGRRREVKIKHRRTERHLAQIENADGQ